ncbi:MAG: hypothetical protein WCX65_10675 [bacterium]
MENSKKVSKITAILNRGAAAPIIEALSDHGITDGHMAVGRVAVLQEKKGLLGAERSIIVEDPVEIISFLISQECAESALFQTIKTGGLDVPGRGMAYSEEVNLLQAHALCVENKAAAFKADAEFPLLSDIVGICCIVQRGQGNAVARVALDTGTCVPNITFGRGTGVRDKLGLLRITIPADKEVIGIVTNKDDAEAVMNLMIDVGKLDQPGKGFIYFYPMNKGIINTKISRGMPKHAASIEQIISVIDEMKGGAKWRSRSGSAETEESKRACLLGLIDMTLICNEGRGEDLVKAAMAVGAAGATISRQKYFCPPGSAGSKISIAREFCNMIISEQQIPTMLDAIGKAGAFDDKTHGQVLSRPVPKACTYLGKK